MHATSLRNSSKVRPTNTCPSVVIAKLFVDVQRVSVDYLIGKTKMELDADALRRLEDISSLSQENKNFVLNMIDMALRDFKTKKAYAK